MFLRQSMTFEGIRDIEQQEQIRLFSNLLAFVFIIVALVLSILWPILAGSAIRLTLIIVTFMVTGVAWFTTRKGWLSITRALVASGYWLLVTLLIFNTGGLTSPWLMSQLIVLGIVGLVVGGGIAVSLAILSVGVDLLFVFFRDPLISTAGVAKAPTEYLASILINFFVIGVVVYFSNRLAKERSDRARENELRYRSLFEKTNDAVFIIGLDDRQIKVNDQAARMLGYEPEEMVGMHIDQVIAPEERAEAHAVSGRLQDEEMLPVYERTMVRKDGSRITVEINVALITDQKGRPLHVQSVVRDVSDRKRMEQQLRDSLAAMEDIAMQDSLTGLLNRRAITEHVDVEWHRSAREKQPMCVLLIDMDNLKVINDQHGHKMGDAALLQLASALRQSKRRYDWMGRWGGDEFLVVLPNTTLMQAKEVAERCRAAIEAEPLATFEGAPIRVAASIGLACYSGRDGDEVTIDVLLAQADQALYRAKESGRNQVAIYRD